MLKEALSYPNTAKIALFKLHVFSNSVTKPYTNSEFSFYNVYRSTEYFKNVNGMKPYASGKEYFGLQTLHNVSWIDRDPATNVQVWYAVTIVTRDGKEMKEVTPAKVRLRGRRRYRLKEHLLHRSTQQIWPYINYIFIY